MITLTRPHGLDLGCNMAWMGASRWHASQYRSCITKCCIYDEDQNEHTDEQMGKSAKKHNSGTEGGWDALKTMCRSAQPGGRIDTTQNCSASGW